jgi:hypothetical protein
MTDFLSQLVKRRETEALAPNGLSEKNSVAPGADQLNIFVQPVDAFGAIEYIITSRQFDTEFYLASYPDIAAASVDPFDHFLTSPHRVIRAKC